MVEILGFVVAMFALVVFGGMIAFACKKISDF